MWDSDNNTYPLNLRVQGQSLREDFLQLGLSSVHTLGHFCLPPVTGWVQRSWASCYLALACPTWPLFPLFLEKSQPSLYSRPL